MTSVHQWVKQQTSRSFVKTRTTRLQFKLPIVHVHEITCRLQATTSRIHLLHEATVQDEELCSLRHIVQTGCLCQIQEIPLDVQSYWNV